LAKLLDQYFGSNGTCEEVAVGTVVVKLDHKAILLAIGDGANDVSMI